MQLNVLDKPSPLRKKNNGSQMTSIMQKTRFFSSKYIPLFWQQDIMAKRASKSTGVPLGQMGWSWTRHEIRAVNHE